ncbi:glycosyl hydrolase family 76-domain-containing protein [Diplogelasinospora grovesii]|uniref:Mannan endo-1,6-alpha-mannosidase n=1 Tax=Diplogelasinospora grovesii TaxID=303347 RepID=A0AAN6S581_9PEZI|nr:glycosyl hydrolase family 76-domain-containing protein [Diplogelasinospora grovesii]
MRPQLVSLLLAFAASGAYGAALEVDLTSSSSIKSAAQLVSHNLMTYYVGNQSGNTPGILPGPPPAGPYYWWEAGAMWGTLVDYWHYTGDTTYNQLATDSLLFQANQPQDNYMPPNWTASLGNDDQGFWGMSAMLAAEVNFPNPPADQPQWLALAQGVFNTQATRWDLTSCNGGLHWQIPSTNGGYDYKNTIANGIFFNLGARLARYTGNSTYARWAEQSWNWTSGVGYIDDRWNVYDGGHQEHNCTDTNPAQWSANAAVILQGSAFMYSYTNGSDIWKTRLDGLLNRTIEVFFPDGIMVEVSCELKDRMQCNTDQHSFKGYMHRWLATITQVAPHTHDTIATVLKTSTKGAVSSCTDDGTCGFRWNTGSYDGDTANGPAGQEMSVLGALSSLLITFEPVQPPLTNFTGGTSQGNPNAGGDPNVIPAPAPLTSADRGGAGVLTALVLVATLVALAWMSGTWSEHGH